jgi:hypothetical protein
MSVCVSCGYCSCCGHRHYPYNYQQPYFPYPYVYCGLNGGVASTSTGGDPIDYSGLQAQAAQQGLYAQSGFAQSGCNAQ